MDDTLDEQQTALLASMHALFLRRGTEGVVPVIERYHLDLRETQRFLIANGRLVETDSSSLSDSTHSSEITSEYGRTPTEPKPSPGPLTPIRTTRKGNNSSQSFPSPSSRHPPHPPGRLTSPSPQRSQQDQSRPSQRSTGTASQQQHSCRTPAPASLVHRRPPPHETPTTPPQFDSPPPSPVPDSPTLSLVYEDEPEALDLNIYSHLVHRDVVPADLAVSIRQDIATGPRDRWYYVTRGKEVGIFNDWAPVGHSTNGIKSCIQHRVDTRALAYYYFRKALFSGQVTISYRKAR